MSHTSGQESTWTHHEADVNGVRLHYVASGRGPLVVLLHGFPEFWYSWRRQIPALVKGGFRVIAPDMRGYNESEKPQGVDAYEMEQLVGDVEGLIRHEGGERAHVVGHDWGGAVAWAFAMRHREMLDRLVVLNAPHPLAYRRELRTPSQLLKSWYAFFFQLPYLPEALFSLHDHFLLRQAYRNDLVHPEAFTERDVERYVEAMSRPRALTSAFNYYRAAFRLRPDHSLSSKVIDAPTLLIWATQDAYLGVGLTRGLDRWVRSLEVAFVEDSGHFVQNERPRRVNDLLLGFL